MGSSALSSSTSKYSYGQSALAYAYLAYCWPTHGQLPIVKAVLKIKYHSLSIGFQSINVKAVKRTLPLAN